MQIEDEIHPGRAASIAVGPPTDSSEPDEDEEQRADEDEGEPLLEPMEVADLEEDEAEMPE